MPTTHRQRWSRLVAALLVAAALHGAEDDARARDKAAAGEVKLDEPAKARLRALHDEASKRGDVWTTLQIEACALKNELKLRPLLGNSVIYGDPLFACPERISRWFDLGETLVVATTSHVYSLAPDGRPLALPIALPRPSDHAAVTPDGGFIASVARSGEDENVYLAVQSLADGHALLDRHLTGSRDEGFTCLPCVAYDGTAVAVAGRSRKRDATRIYAASTADAGAVGIDGYSAPIGVGAAGKWLICSSEDGHKRFLMTREQKEPLPLRDAACGLGVALALDATEAAVVGRDGKLAPLAPPFALSDSARVMAVGAWAVLFSGYDAKTLASVDALGGKIPGGARQPPTFGLYRWKDLVAQGGQAQPAVTLEGDPQLARGEPAALYLRHGEQLDLLDLGKDEPAARPFYTARARIDQLGQDWLVTALKLEGGEWVMLDAQGRELWSGAVAGDPRLFHPLWLLLTAKDVAKPYTLCRLDADPAQRTQVALDLPVGDWSFGYDPAEERVVAWQQNAWVALDPRSGARVAGDANGGATTPRPRVGGVADEIGRFYADPGSARLHRKGVARDDAALMQWDPADVWRVQRTLLVLERNGQLLSFASGRRGAKVIGTCANADRLAHADEVPVVVDSAGKPLAAVAGGPSLSKDLPGRQGKSDEMPIGIWRVDNNDASFFTPRSGGLVWNAERVGFSPRRLRSPDAGGMLIVTDSLIIELEPAAAKVVGKQK